MFALFWGEIFDPDSVEDVPARFPWLTLTLFTIIGFGIRKIYKVMTKPKQEKIKEEEKGKEDQKDDCEVVVKKNLDE